MKFKTIYGQENVAEYRVAAIFDAQMDVAAYVDRENLNAYIEMPSGSYNLCGIKLADYRDLDAKTKAIYALLKGEFDLLPYEKIVGKDANAIVADLEKESFDGQKTIVTNLNNELGSIVSVLTGVQAGSYGLFLVILAVIMVGLVNTFRIVIYERTKEIGTMRALGAQRSQVRNLFVAEATFLGVAGSVPGALAGILALKIIGLFKFDSFTELSLFLDGGRLSSSIGVGMLVFSVCTVILFTLLAALVPARRAARMEPAQALRSQF